MLLADNNRRLLVNKKQEIKNMFSLKSTKARLEREKADIEKEIKSLSKPPEANEDTDHGDEKVDEIEEIGNQLSLQQNLRNRLENINESLRKIELGKYGICERCGQKISWLIMKLEPTSKLCGKCKKEIRKK